MIIACDLSDMAPPDNIRPNQEKTGNSGLIRELADPNLKRVRTRLAAHSLTDLRNLFFHDGAAPKRKDGKL